MRFMSDITRYLSGYFNALASRVSLLVVLTAALLFVQLAAPPPSSADCGGGCTPSTCCDFECTFACCYWDRYENYCVNECFICFQVCSYCCV